jgi:hypothetical protein
MQSIKFIIHEVATVYRKLLGVLFALSLVSSAHFSSVFQLLAISIRSHAAKLGFHAVTISNSREKRDKLGAVAYVGPYAARLSQSMPSVVPFVLD